jgi:hypothetical protein
MGFMGMGMGAGAEAEAEAGTGAEAEKGMMQTHEPIPVTAAAVAISGGSLAAPATATARLAVRDAVANSVSWSDALPALMKHWAAHGTGDVAAHSVLHWSLKVHPARYCPPRHPSHFEPLFCDS